MRSFIPVLLVALLAGPVHAAGGLDAGGGIRTSGQIRVHDVLGAPVAGQSGAGATMAGSGLLYGVSIPTPVTLVSLQITAAQGVVEIAWSAPEDAGVIRFTLERAEGAQGDLFAPLDARFEGQGPHVYRDLEVTAGASYRYRLVALLRSGEVERLGPWPVSLDASPRPTALRAFPARPNPFREALELVFELPGESGVAWRIYDVRGALVAQRDLGRKTAGTHAVFIRAPEGVAHGIYFLELQAGAAREVQKVVMLP